MRGIIHLIFILCGGMLFSTTAQAVCTLTKPVVVNYGTQSSVLVNTTPQTQTVTIQLNCTTVLNIAAPGYINVNYASTTPTNSPRALLTSSTTTYDPRPTGLYFTYVFLVHRNYRKQNRCGFQFYATHITEQYAIQSTLFDQHRDRPIRRGRNLYGLPQPSHQLEHLYHRCSDRLRHCRCRIGYAFNSRDLNRR